MSSESAHRKPCAFHSATGAETVCEPAPSNTDRNDGEAINAISHVASTIEGGSVLLPKVRVKNEYRYLEAMCTQDARHGSRTDWLMGNFKDYRRVLKQNRALSGFKTHIARSKEYCLNVYRDRVLAVQRILHMVEVNQRALLHENEIGDPAVSVSLFVTESYEIILSSPMCRPGHNGSLSLLHGLLEYVEWQQSRAIALQCKFQTFISPIAQLSSDLRNRVKMHTAASRIDFMRLSSRTNALSH